MINGRKLVRPIKKQGGVVRKGAYLKEISDGCVINFLVDCFAGDFR